MTLVEFLTARLDEDEQLARGVEQSVGSERKGEPYSDGSGIAAGDAFPSYPWGALPEELPFMAGPGHPSRVLADVAAKRSILAEHLPDMAREYRDGAWRDRPQCGACVTWRGEGEAVPAPAPCLTLRRLAVSYADHPDFDPAWRS